jgi:hypothetical protein
MVRSTLLGLALAAGFLISIPTGNARPAVVPSLEMKESLVHTGGMADGNSNATTKRRITYFWAEAASRGLRHRSSGDRAA